MFLQCGRPPWRQKRFSEDLAVLGFGRTAVPGGPPPETRYDLVIEIAHNQVSHAIDDSAASDPVARPPRQMDSRMNTAGRHHKAPEIAKDWYPATVKAFGS
jgi:hypothetical protein